MKIFEKKDKSQVKEDNEQIIKKISPQNAFDLIEKNKDNPNFTILDVRTLKDLVKGILKMRTSYLPVPGI
ncbi:MAG: hypothetical protein FJ150_05875 [Euryarchaeota archaeon]|nr:hypothetical protein [Euryarchaeota archaeon]